MRSLTLLRHAEAGSDDPALRDFDRPLTPAGRETARRMGRYLRDEGLAFDHVLASPAVRVAETLAELARGYGGSFEITSDRRVYLAPTALLLDLIRILPAQAARVLIVGHNPGLEELVPLFTASGEGAGHFPTTALAQIRFAGDTWPEITPGSGRLDRFVRPRDLRAGD